MPRQASVTNVVPVTYDQNTFSSAEDWEEETTSTTFSLWEDSIENPFAAVEAYQDNLLVNIEQKKPMKSTSGLTKTQKKNEKRAEKRREKNAANASSEHENYNHLHDNNENGSLDDEDTLGKMAREYSPPGRAYSSNSAFVDWVSILNIYCQKHKINQPQYKEDKTRFGGFGYCVAVGVKKFWTGSYCSTKKDAKHSAARSALLGLNVSVSTPDPCRAPHMASDYERAQQLAQNAQILQSKITPQNRIIPGHNPTNVQASQSDISKTIAATESKLKKVVIKEENEDDGWQVAGRKRATNQDYLKLAGMGRGRGRRWRS
ncbi:uncharacterized protein LOC124436421 isoform X2 [Xenia sp. Carnegie-2017]|uniref:uncharacterized protein LOC124436421 isoform X2 n=1 Tax=Xenia sp. Carnegie-2017 TaxID=2897299 RepID=UPI001F04A1D7|nr:uncharacterized protein LOC124436421 isoform X2 [Xenia sp. Carnegie-2017]